MSGLETGVGARKETATARRSSAASAMSIQISEEKTCYSGILLAFYSFIFGFSGFLFGTFHSQLSDYAYISLIVAMSISGIMIFVAICFGNFLYCCQACRGGCCRNQHCCSIFCCLLCFIRLNKYNTNESDTIVQIFVDPKPSPPAVLRTLAEEQGTSTDPLPFRPEEKMDPIT